MWLNKLWATRREPIPDPDWLVLLAALPLPVAPGDQALLRKRCEQFLASKTFAGGDGFEIDDRVRGTIALHACVPILRLGLDWYGGWSTIIVYPEAFYARHEHYDDAGVAHFEERVHSGEAWLRGPVVLSWPHVLAGGVAIHEFAHKLDMRNGRANGMPPLHRGMNRKQWTRDFSAAYDDFCARVDRDRPTPFDAYAAEAPSEFFAVASELFFLDARTLWRAYPAVYRQLQAFYRQDPNSVPTTLFDEKRT